MGKNKTKSIIEKKIDNIDNPIEVEKEDELKNNVEKNDEKENTSKEVNERLYTEDFIYSSFKYLSVDHQKEIMKILINNNLYEKLFDVSGRRKAINIDNIPENILMLIFNYIKEIKQKK